jgi:hypothetical protein
MRIGQIEPMSDQEFDALLHGDAEDDVDPQLAAIMAWIQTGGPFRVALQPGQSGQDVARTIARAAARHGLHVATVVGDGFVAVRKVGGAVTPE